jgi:hypothetical protein
MQGSQSSLSAIAAGSRAAWPAPRESDRTQSKTLLRSTQFPSGCVVPPAAPRGKAWLSRPTLSTLLDRLTEPLRRKLLMSSQATPRVPSTIQTISSAALYMFRQASKLRWTRHWQWCPESCRRSRRRARCGCWNPPLEVASAVPLLEAVQSVRPRSPYTPGEWNHVCMESMSTSQTA